MLLSACACVCFCVRARANTCEVHGSAQTPLGAKCSQIRRVESLQTLIMASSSPSTPGRPLRGSAAVVQGDPPPTPPPHFLPLFCLFLFLLSQLRSSSRLRFAELVAGVYLTGATSCLNTQPPRMIPSPPTSPPLSSSFREALAHVNGRYDLDFLFSQ